MHTLTCRYSHLRAGTRTMISMNDGESDDGESDDGESHHDIWKFVMPCFKECTESHWILKYDFRRDFYSDFIAAIVIAVMVLPQSIAYAQLAGLPSEYGIYASVYPALSYSLFNGT